MPWRLLRAANSGDQGAAKGVRSLVFRFGHPSRGPNDQKNLISIEIFDLDRKFQSRRLDFPTKKKGPRWTARSKISFSLEIFNLARNLNFF